jgi:ParB/RepB/Spo0J family partition protein
MVSKFDNIKLGEIKIDKFNVRKKEIQTGLEELKQSIKVFGLMQPITVYFDAVKKVYVIIAGQRRFNTYTVLNEENPNEGYDTIEAKIIDEPATEDLKKALSLTENLTQVQMENTDVVRAVTDLYNTYRDYDIVQQEFALTRFMIDKYVSLARLPERLVQAINEGEISPNTKGAENAAIRAVKALNWTKGGDVEVEDVMEFAKEYAKGDIQKDTLDRESKKGGSIAEIKARASKKSVKELNKLKLSTEVFAKLTTISDQFSEKPEMRATSYIIKGVSEDYKKLSESE